MDWNCPYESLRKKLTICQTDSGIIGKISNEFTVIALLRKNSIGITAF